MVERRKQAQRHSRQPRPRIEIPHRAQHLLRRHRERRPGPFRPLERGVRTRLPFVRGCRTRRVLGRCFVEGHRSFVHFAQRFVAPAQRCLVGVRQGFEVPRRSVDLAQRFVGGRPRFVHFAQRFVVGVRHGVEGHRRSVDRAQILVVGVRHGVEGHRRSVDRAQSLVGDGLRFVHFALHFVATTLRFVDLRRRSI